MVRQLVNLGWRMRAEDEKTYRNAKVPGSVYADLLADGAMEDPYWKDNEYAALKLMEKEYIYETRFNPKAEVIACDRKILHFYGLDTLATVYLNDAVILEADNMHREWDADVTDILAPSDNKLKIVFHSSTKFIARAYAECPTQGTEDSMQGFPHIRKAHCAFGWDWGPHEPDAGIYRDVELRGINEIFLDNVYITQTHTKAGGVTLKLKPEFRHSNGKAAKAVDYRVELTCPNGETTMYEGSPKSIKVENPKLWWPNGYGEHPLYMVKLVAQDAIGQEISCEKRIGLRTMTVTREKDQWGESFAFTINGVQIFAMGADYIPEDNVIGRVTPETTRKLLERAVFANFNCIRVWGGGYYPENWFYDACDELGLLVWQDFMFACAMYELTPKFEANIRAEFVDNIRRLRHHASLGLWCGNNEMESFASKGTWVSKPSEIDDYFKMYEEILPEILGKEDPNTFYWPASPSSGGHFDNPDDENRGDVHDWSVWHADASFSIYRDRFHRFISEFGFQSFPSEKTVDTFTDDPADKNIFSYVMEKHQRNGSANGKIMSYMQQTYKYPTKFDTLIYASQLLQADAIRYGTEHFRQYRGRCMGAVYWQLNDCWPVASWSSIDYCGRLKALHYSARRFFAPIMISCEEQSAMTARKMINLLPDDFEKSIKLNVANETMKDIEAKVTWELRNNDGSLVKSDTKTVTVAALSSLWLDKVDMADADEFTQYIFYYVEVENQIVSSGSVLFTYPKYFKFKNPELAYSVEGDEIVIAANAYARGVEIRNSEDNLILSDNFFDMNPGERRIKVLEGKLEGLKLRSNYEIG